MNSKRLILQIIGLTLTLCLLAGCGSPVAAPTTIPTANPSPAGTGTITGRVHLVAPPTPGMVVYAVDPTTGAWAFAETQATESEAPFTITVPPGTYQVFAAVASDSSIGVGYSIDRKILTPITVAANQTVSGIEVGPPGQSECGAVMGYPASPDGRFTGRPGPTAECIATIQASSSNSITETGTITGSVHLMAPPVPSMTVYAVNQTTGEWAFAKTEASDSGTAPFSIVVRPGTYVVYGNGVGYSLDSLTLTSVTVAENQTVSDISVGLPSQFECGSMMGYPAAPDGSFAEIPGPSAECLATSQASGNPALPQTNRIQFQPNATSWQISDNIAPNATIGFVLYAMQGQQMNINLSTEPASSADPYVVFSISADVIITFVPVTSWSAVLGKSQDYYITVMSMSQQTVKYTLSVEILP
jgi:hypothetical protein